jgi:hypothetical protein
MSSYQRLPIILVGNANRNGGLADKFDIRGSLQPRKSGSIPTLIRFAAEVGPDVTFNEVLTQRQAL